MHAQIAVELEPDMQHITLASHTTLRLVAHVALAHQAYQVKFELVEDMQQQNTSWTRHQVVCIMFKEIVQLNFYSRKNIMQLILDLCKKKPNRFSQYLYCA